MEEWVTRRKGRLKRAQLQINIVFLSLFPHLLVSPSPIKKAFTFSLDFIILFMLELIGEVRWKI